MADIKVIATADLHYPFCREKLPGFAEEVNDSGADVLVIAGDIAEGVEGYHEKCLSYFKHFPGIKIAVLGNHDIWTESEDSYERYSNLLPKILADNGFHCLDKSPLEINVNGQKTGFVGNMGWYDYSFKSMEETEGAIISSSGPRKLKEIGDDIYAGKKVEFIDSSGQLRFFQWNDKKYVKWGFADKEFTETCCKNIYRQLKSTEADTVISVLHHIPFREMLLDKNSFGWRFGNAFTGSKALGDILKKDKRVKVAICGHTHHPLEKEISGIRCYNVGGEYGNPFHKVINI